MQKFEKKYLIRSYETDQNGDLRLVTLLNIMQDMADVHAEQLGFGLSFCRQNNLTWFGANYHIRLLRLPKIHEEIRVQTWPSVKKKIGAVREFLIYDQAGEPFVFASSLWILIDVARRKPIAVEKAVPTYMPIEDRALETDFPKLVMPESFDIRMTEKARFDDIDLNGHVNNAVYPLWATECMTPDFRLTHQPAEIEIAYKKECLVGEQVDVLAKNEAQTTMYAVRAQSDGRSLADLCIRWVEKISV